jgi:glycosyltransferase involved in cell wall biosynthesis
MHIAINASFYNQPNTGSGQYLHGLLTGLQAVAPHHRYTLLVPAETRRPGDQETSYQLPITNHQSSTPEIVSQSHHLPVSPSASIISLSAHLPVSLAKGLAKLWFEQIAVPQAAQRLGADILHVPYFAPPLYSRVPVVASVLDVIPLILPEYRGNVAVQAYMRLVSAAARRAAHVIAISHASKTDIIQQLGIPAERITVTHLAAGSQYIPSDKQTARAVIAARYGIISPFMYYVGGHDARKNVATLVRGFAHMRRNGGPALPLVIAGHALGSNPRLFPDLDTVIVDEGASDWIKRVEVPNADGALFYQAAALFAAPSRYEGFGLNPLEAMACGTPVIAANTSSVAEVVGDAAICVDANDPIAWANAIRQVLENPRLSEDLRQRGLARATQFSYQHTAHVTAEVYKIP